MFDASSHPLKQLHAWQRFHIRLTLFYGGAILCALSILGVRVYQSEVKLALGGLQKRLLSTVTSLASSIPSESILAIGLENKELTSTHLQFLERFKEVAQQDEAVDSIYILRPTDEPTKLRFMVDYSKDGDSGTPGEIYDASEIPVMLRGFARPSVEEKPFADEFGMTLSGYAPILDPDGKSIAIVGVDVDVSQLDALKFNVLKEVAFAFGIAMVLLGTVSLLVAKNVQAPLTRIIGAAIEISRGNLSTRTGMQRLDELGVMGRHIDLMAEQLQEREFLREAFGRHVSEDIAHELLDRKSNQALKGEERVVSVLFCDLKGYSTISEQMPPVQIVEMLNQYLSAMTEAVDKHKGCIIEFIGDAVFAVFGAPKYIADHAEQSVQCAIEMQRRMGVLNQDLAGTEITRFWKSEQKSGLQIRVGIHSGRVVAGNLGSTTRMKYAVIGDTVNVAARLEAMNKTLGTDILLSRAVFSQLPDDLASEMVDLGEQEIRGREQHIQVYSPKKQTS